MLLITPVKFFVKWGKKGCWCLIVPIFMILQAQPPSAVSSSLAFIVQDYPSTDELTRSDKITAQGSIPAGKTKVALESFSHSLEHINVQIWEVFQWQRETDSPVNAVALFEGGALGSPPQAAGSPVWVHLQNTTSTNPMWLYWQMS